VRNCATLAWNRWAPTVANQLAVQVVLTTLLCAPPRAAENRAVPSVDIIVGDVKVNLVARSRESEPAVSKYVSIRVSDDARFQYTRPLRGLIVAVKELRSDELTSTRGRAAELAAMAPELYAVPNSMSVFRANPSQVVIRLDGAKFFGRTPYFICSIRGAIYPRGQEARQCFFDGTFTERASVALAFTDNNFPAREWPGLLKSIESGIRRISTRS
jgi:hypothetical protein